MKKVDVEKKKAKSIPVRMQKKNSKMEKTNKEEKKKSLKKIGVIKKRVATKKNEVKKKVATKIEKAPKKIERKALKKIRKILALIFDIDGSIMPQGGPIDPRVARFFRKLWKAGLKMGPATGKNADYCRGLACGIGVVWDVIIAETGAQFLELISATPPSFRQRKLPGIDMDLSRFLEIINYRQFGRTFQFYDRLENFRPELKEGILTLFPAGSHLECTLPWVPYFEGIIRHFRLALKVQRHSDGCIDIVPSAVSKALGLKNVCDTYNIKRRNIITVVDGVNDFELTQEGVLPIAVGNAVDEIKAAVRAAGGYVAKGKYGNGFIEGMKHFAALGYFEPRLAEIILNFR